MIITNVSTGRREVGGFTKQQILDFPPPIPRDSCWTEFWLQRGAASDSSSRFIPVSQQSQTWTGQPRRSRQLWSSPCQAHPELGRTSKGLTVSGWQLRHLGIPPNIFKHAFHPFCSDPRHFEKHLWNGNSKLFLLKEKKSQTASS